MWAFNRKYLAGFSLVFFVAIIGCSCQPVHEAELWDASFLEKGSPVYIAGVEAGRVQSVNLEANRARVAFTIDRQHDVSFHGDACALSLGLDGVGRLFVWPGEKGSFEKDVLPPCEFRLHELQELSQDLGRALGDLSGAFTEGLLQSLQRSGASQDTLEDIAEAAPDLLESNQDEPRSSDNDREPQDDE